MGGPSHKWVGPPIVTHGTNNGGPFFRGANGWTMHTNPWSRREPIGWGAVKAGTHPGGGAIKTHCTAMDSVAANRRLKSCVRKSKDSNPGFAKGWFPKGWFWQMFPCTAISSKKSKKSFPAVLSWQKKAVIFDFPAPPKPEQDHIRQNRPFTKPPFCFLSPSEAASGSLF